MISLFKMSRLTENNDDTFSLQPDEIHYIIAPVPEQEELESPIEYVIAEFDEFGGSMLGIIRNQYDICRPTDSQLHTHLELFNDQNLFAEYIPIEWGADDAGIREELGLDNDKWAVYANNKIYWMTGNSISEGEYRPIKIYKVSNQEDIYDENDLFDPTPADLAYLYTHFSPYVLDADSNQYQIAKTYIKNQRSLTLQVETPETPEEAEDRRRRAEARLRELHAQQQQTLVELKEEVKEEVKDVSRPVSEIGAICQVNETNMMGEKFAFMKNSEIIGIIIPLRNKKYVIECYTRNETLHLAKDSNSIYLKGQDNVRIYKLPYSGIYVDKQSITILTMFRYFVLGDLTKGIGGYDQPVTYTYLRPLLKIDFVSRNYKKTTFTATRLEALLPVYVGRKYVEKINKSSGIVTRTLLK